MAGDSILDIKTWEIVHLTAQTNANLRNISLIDVAYIPIFHINLIFLKKALIMGFHWDTRFISIIKGSVTFLTVKIMHDQFVAEYNSCRTPSNAVFISIS